MTHGKYPAVLFFFVAHVSFWLVDCVFEASEVTYL